MPISNTVKIGEQVQIIHEDLVNLYGCTIGDHTQVGPFVEIQKGVHIGSSCKISSHAFICEGVVIEDRVFVGHGVTFTNDRFPRATTEDGRLQSDDDWELEPTIVRAGASLGSNATILPGLTIGRDAMVAAGAVVTKSVSDFAIVSGTPAGIVGDVRERSKTQDNP